MLKFRRKCCRNLHTWNFDEIDFTRTLLNTIRTKKGLEPITSEVKSFKEFKNREYDRLADMLRENLDMEKIYEIVENSSK